MRAISGRLALMLLLCAVLATAGCSFYGGDNSGSRSDDEATDNQPFTIDGHERVTLTYATWGSPNEKQVQERIVKGFMEKYPWITVQYLFVPGDYVKRMTTLYAANKAPDVYMLYKHTALQWAEQGKIYNLNEFLSQDTEINEADFIPNSVMYWAPGKVAGIKVTEESFALYYNKEMFDEAGVDLPPSRAEDAWTWEEFVYYAKRLTLDEEGNNALSASFNPNEIKQYGVRFNSWAWHLFVPSNETSVVKPDQSGLNLEDPAVIEAVQRLSDLIYVHHVAPSPIQEKSLPTPDIAMQSKKIAMDMNGQWVQLDLAATGIEYGVGVLPKLKKSVTVQFGEPVVMSQTTKHPKEAWLFYKWLLDAESALDMHASGLWMPTMKDYYTKPELIDKWATVAPGHAEGYEDAVMRQTLENGVNSFDYYVKNIEKINGILIPALDQIWLGQKNVKEAFEAIMPKINAEFKGTYP
ncbi:ABC transporter substrate-binding protein [Paenibacillus sp. YIM B09110]|uniref:ABC transporter substrate-binding protein n=1 Tax=Paenibacillus sp. YIM B09110 TaxID=3126102 RepID=UPI00301DD1EF